jgi:hypothetical protein
MAATTYTYSIADDFPGGAVNTAKLHAEIQASAIVTALEGINTSGDVIEIVFKDALSAGDKTILDGDTTGPAGGLIAAHDNTASPSSITETQILNEAEEVVNWPMTTAKTPIYQPNIVPPGYLLYMTGAFDDIAGGNLGTGLLMQATKTDNGDATVEGQFLHHAYVLGGGFGTNGEGYGDYATMEIYAPASAPEDKTGTSDGNANKVDTGLGFYIIVPAPLNDGDWNVDGATLQAGEINQNLVPIPNETQQGYWNWDPDANPSITPVANPGAPDGDYDLFDAQITLARQANRIPLFVKGDITPPTIKGKKILPHWKWKFTLHRESTGTVEGMFYVLVGRKKTV